LPSGKREKSSKKRGGFPVSSKGRRRKEKEKSCFGKKGRGCQASERKKKLKGVERKRVVAVVKKKKTLGFVSGWGEKKKGRAEEPFIGEKGKKGGFALRKKKGTYAKRRHSQE